METNVNYTIVGAFVVMLVAAIVFSIIWLSSGFSLQHYSTYLVYEQESVSGLSIDSTVEFNGVSVGSVKSIQLNVKDPHLVEVFLDIQKGTPITQGTVATLNSRGLTGITFIALKDKGTDLRPLVIKDGQSYPVINTAPSFFMRLDIALDRLSKNISRVAESIQSVLDPQNQLALKGILLNMQRITNTLAGNSDRINKIFLNTERASQQFGPFVQSSAGAMHTIQSQTLPTFYQLMSNLENATRTINEVSAELKQNPTILIRGATPPTLGPGETK